MPAVGARGPWVGLAVVLIGAAPNGCGGSLGNPGGMGGSPDPAGRGGTTGVAGWGGPGGRGGAGGTAGVFGEPVCASSVAKGVPCGISDQQFCYKGCGPAGMGVKSEACVGGLYAEMSGCTFDLAGDYSCYRVPTAANSACPEGSAGSVPAAGTSCDVPPCMVCNDLQGVSGGTYRDAGGAVRVGYCVCQPPDASGARTWTCASDTAWPCPVGTGCGGSFGEPACPAGVSGFTPCLPDVPFCYRACGPENVGVQSETCQTSGQLNGVYLQMSGCAFDPARDFSCYKIPTAANAVCAIGVTPEASKPCDVPHCTLCNSLQGLTGGQFLDTTGAPKVGWCVCREPNSVGQRTWSCGSDTSWPCPLGRGC